MRWWRGRCSGRARGCGSRPIPSTRARGSNDGRSASIGGPTTSSTWRARWRRRSPSSWARSSRPRSRTRVERQETQDKVADDLYRRGLYFWGRSSDDVDRDRSRQLFEAAVERDPNSLAMPGSRWWTPSSPWWAPSPTRSRRTARMRGGTPTGRSSYRKTCRRRTGPRPR